MIYVNADGEATELCFVPQSHAPLCVNELSLRTQGRVSAYDLGHEMQIMDEPHFVFATIDRPVDGKIEREARAIAFGSGTVTEVKLTTL